MVNAAQDQSGFARFVANRWLSVPLSVALLGLTGAAIVKASDNPGILQVMREFNKPVRQAVQAVMPAPERLPKIFRSSITLSAPKTAPSQRAMPIPLPQGALQSQSGGFFPTNADRAATAQPTQDMIKKPRHAARKALTQQAAWKEGQGLPQTTSYCVRLCDGYAFPIGTPERGSTDAHEAACSLACPGSPTALYTAAAGSQDLHEARNTSGANYTSLKTAFAYRVTYDKTCTCRPKGNTQSTAALMSDFTMRKGDLIMSRIGVRMFEGSRQLPYRPAQFADAVSRLESKTERAQVRAMEAASLRGEMSPLATAALKERVVDHIRQAERMANAGRKLEPVQGLKRGFEEMKAQMGPNPVRVVDKRVGFVAMN